MTAAVVTTRATPTRMAARPVAGGGDVCAEVHVDAGDPVFAGHYPGFPVLPGVYLIEFVDQAVRLRLDGAPVTLTAIERCRFLRPVYGGDRLDIAVTLTRADGDVRCSASVRTGGVAVADIRLRHRAEPAA